MKKTINVILDIIAVCFAIAAIIQIGWIAIVASIFLGVEWYEWLGLAVVIAFVAWRFIRFSA